MVGFGLGRHKGGPCVKGIRIMGYTAQQYHSFSGSMTLEEAVSDLGRDHVQWLMADWHHRLSLRISGTWRANLGRNHKAYCALMQAGQALTEQQL